MKKAKKPTFFIVAALILAFTYLSIFGLSTYYGDNKLTYFKGVDDIRWGIDIQGGVEAIFMPEGKIENITNDDMEKAEQIIKVRLMNNNIADAEVDRDNVNKRVIVRFPWQSGDTDFDPNKAVKELGATAMLTFCEGTDNTKVVLSGSADIMSAKPMVDERTGTDYLVELQLTEQGKTKFAEATKRLLNSTISIWMDDQMISSPTVNQVITGGKASITGDFSADEVQALAEKINAGSLPFKLSVDDSKLSIISPTLGKQSLNVMLIAGIIAYAIIVILMIALYRVPGVIAAISVTGQIAGIFACVSGFFPAFDSFTLTIPGIAGLILSIGMGVDANVITAERIKEEIRSGKTIDGSIQAGFDRGFSAIFDGNVTVVIVSVILMGAFGPPSSIWAQAVNLIMFMFKSSITGSIYSFGYTLLIGSIFNLIIGVFLTRLMLTSLSRFKAFRKPWLYGGVKNAK
ncbi:MAG: protein translocase subunit SecD [Clostridia bacterium]|nr:protein translocase subunit SecD [Clostridia bacterium]